jgi:hypothetical protein
VARDSGQGVGRRLLLMVARAPSSVPSHGVAPSLGRFPTLKFNVEHYSWFHRPLGVAHVHVRAGHGGGAGLGSGGWSQAFAHGCAGALRCITA